MRRQAYNVIFTGQIRSGITRTAFRHVLQTRFAFSKAAWRQIDSGERALVQEAVCWAQALQVQAAFERAGGIVELEATTAATPGVGAATPLDELATGQRWAPVRLRDKALPNKGRPNRPGVLSFKFATHVCLFIVIVLFIISLQSPLPQTDARSQMIVSRMQFNHEQFQQGPAKSGRFETWPGQQVRVHLAMTAVELGNVETEDLRRDIVSRLKAAGYNCVDLDGPRTLDLEILVDQAEAIGTYYGKPPAEQELLYTSARIGGSLVLRADEQNYLGQPFVARGKAPQSVQIKTQDRYEDLSPYTKPHYAPFAATANALLPYQAEVFLKSVLGEKAADE